ncbi:MAG: primosomal protein N', partial [Bilophila sp.]
LATVLPSGLKVTRMRLRTFGAQGKAHIRFLKELPALERDELRALGTAWLAGKAELLAPREDAAASEQCVLQSDPPWSVRPSATRQLALLDFLLEHGAVSRRDVLRKLGQSAAPALEALLKHGLVAIRQATAEEQEGMPESDLLPPPVSTAFPLSAAQNAALAAFTVALDSGKPASHLLFGVTGSGKTVVYLELVRECLRRGRSALLLAPEVALAMKLRRDAASALPDVPLYFFHGYQTPQFRENTFRELAHRREPCLVVGTRSALFLPLPDLGVIMMDEEHDASFKQDEGLTYQAKEVAWFRVAQANGLLVLGSATPDLKTYYAVHESKIAVSTLPARVGGGTLPEIRLVDIKSASNAESLLSPESTLALKETVERGEQVVVLLNRRGYAPLMYCLDCGKVARCPQCDIGLTYHKGRERLICHYCGYSVPFPSACPGCKGLHYHPMGQGTERIEEHIATLLPPGGRVLRLDRDSTRRPGRIEEILEAFAHQEAQVLVGTQMLSKGHLFPEVTLAIIADGDLGLNLPDYRAAERTFQLLVQSAGRAGRGEKPGQVIIQTRDVQHYCWKFVKEGDYEGFYAHEIALRQRRRYPPFINLALLRISYPVEWEDGAAHLAKITAQLRSQSQEKGVTVLGPAPAPLPLLRGRRRFQCLFKAASWQAIRALYAAVSPFAVPPHLRISLDIDPVNML